MAKYIVVQKGSSDNEAMVIFDDLVSHASMYSMLKNTQGGEYIAGDLKSAGKVKIDADSKPYCKMGSVTLKISYNEKRNSEDDFLVSQMFRSLF